jgi:hypothetical protein
LKHLLTLIVCALLTVGLILCAETVVESTVDSPVAALWILVLVAMLPLPPLILVATIWSVIGFTKTVNRWIAENQVDDCPHVMHSWHSKDAAQMKKDYQRALMYGASPSEDSHDLLEQHLKKVEHIRQAYDKPCRAIARQVACLCCKGKGRCLSFSFEDGLLVEKTPEDPCEDCGGTGTVAATDDEFTILIDQEYGYTYFKWIIKGYEQLEIEFLVDAVIKHPHYCWCGGPTDNPLSFAGEWTEIDYEEYVLLVDTDQYDAGGHFHTTDDSHFSFKQ